VTTAPIWPSGRGVRLMIILSRDALESWRLQAGRPRGCCLIRRVPYKGSCTAARDGDATTTRFLYYGETGLPVPGTCQAPRK
jgi:hypothetical protein